MTFRHDRFPKATSLGSAPEWSPPSHLDDGGSAQTSNLWSAGGAGSGSLTSLMGGSGGGGGGSTPTGANPTDAQLNALLDASFGSLAVAAPELVA